MARAAWVIVLLVSAAPAIVWSELTGGVAFWLAAAQLMVLGTVVVAGTVRPGLRPLRNFAVVMIALVGLTQLLPTVDVRWPALPYVFGHTGFDARMQAEQTTKLIVTLAMIGVLRLLGYRRREFFLAIGDLSAPIRPVRLLGFPRPDPWWRFGLIWGFGIAAALAAGLYLSGSPGSGWVAVPAMLPSIACYAALNAFNEEMTYRAPMLATLEPAVGSTHALWQTAVFFGVAHYFGTPGGLIGAVLSIFMGWMLGKAMVETRGLLWAWWIHFLSDLVIFTFLAAGPVV